MLLYNEKSRSIGINSSIYTLKQQAVHSTGLSTLSGDSKIKTSMKNKNKNCIVLHSTQ
jgi:hypothetical protein